MMLQNRQRRGAVLVGRQAFQVAFTVSFYLFAVMLCRIALKVKGE
jgi:hypothetical protein